MLLWGHGMLRRDAQGNETHVPVEDVQYARCPRCKQEQADFDGFGVLFCACGYCTHPSIDDNKCGCCGDVITLS